MKQEKIDFYKEIIKTAIDDEHLQTIIETIITEAKTEQLMIDHEEAIKKLGL